MSDALEKSKHIKSLQNILSTKNWNHNEEWKSDVFKKSSFP